MKFKPQNGLIAVRLNAVKKTESGIFIPDNATTETTLKGTVVGVSMSRVETTRDYVHSAYNEGDQVAFLRNQGVIVKDDEGDLVILKEEQILGKFVE